MQSGWFAAGDETAAGGDDGHNSVRMHRNIIEDYVNKRNIVGRKRVGKD